MRVRMWKGGGGIIRSYYITRGTSCGITQYVWLLDYMIDQFAVRHWLMPAGDYGSCRFGGKTYVLIQSKKIEENWASSLKYSK